MVLRRGCGGKRKERLMDAVAMRTFRDDIMCNTTTTTAHFTLSYGDQTENPNLTALFHSFHTI
jgi:hypothetical protein